MCNRPIFGRRAQAAPVQCSPVQCTPVQCNPVQCTSVQSNQGHCVPSITYSSFQNTAPAVCPIVNYYPQAPTIQSSSNTGPRSLTEVVGNRKFEDLVPEIDAHLGAANRGLLSQITKPEGDQLYTKEIRFTAKGRDSQAKISTIHFNQDSYGFLTKTTYENGIGEDNLVSRDDSQWKVEVNNTPEGRQYTIRLKHGFAGAVKIESEGRTEIFYSHKDSPTSPPMTAAAPPLPAAANPIPSNSSSPPTGASTKEPTLNSTNSSASGKSAESSNKPSNTRNQPQIADNKLPPPTIAQTPPPPAVAKKQPPPVVPPEQPTSSNRSDHKPGVILTSLPSKTPGNNPANIPNSSNAESKTSKPPESNEKAKFPPTGQPPSVTKDLSVGAAPSLVPAPKLESKPKIDWPVHHPLAPPTTLKSVIIPSIELPRWAADATGISFDRQSLERATKIDGLMEFLSGGVKAEEEILTKRHEQPGGAEVLKKEEAWYSDHISQAYKPFYALHSAMQDAAVTTAEIQAANKATGRTWSQEDIKEVNEKLKLVQKYYQVAASGGGPIGKEGSTSLEGCDVLGTGAKIRGIEQRLEVLSQKQTSLTEGERSQQEFLKERLVRMREFSGWLTRLEPAMGLIDHSIRAEKPWLVLSDPEASPRNTATTYAKAKEQLTAAVAGLSTADGRRGLTKALDSLTKIDASQPRLAEIEFGSTENVTALRTNLAAIRSHLQQPSYSYSIYSEQYSKLWQRTSTTLTTSEPTAKKAEKLAGDFEQHLGRSLNSSEKDHLLKGVHSFENGKTAQSRTELLTTLVQPVITHWQTRAADEVKTLTDQLSKVDRNLARLEESFSLQKVALTSDQAYLDFVRAIPSLADRRTSGDYFSLRAGSAKKAEVTKSLKTLETEAERRITEEIGTIEAIDSAKDGPIRARVAALKVRLENIVLYRKYQEQENRE